MAGSSAHISLRFSQGEEKTAKVAVTTSKKVSKSAVTRNTVRRRVYSALRPIVSRIKPGLYLFITKKGADKLRGEKLSSELDLLLKGFERG